MADDTITTTATGEAPERAGLVLAALILVAGVANLNLSVANVALPDIGQALRLVADHARSDRVLGGLSAGMAYPTTLALIAALWSGPGRTKSIALCRRSAERSPRSSRWSPARCWSSSPRGRSS